MQIQLNYLDWEDNNVQSKACYEVCEKYNKPVAIMEPLKGGALVNVSEDVEAVLREANPDMSVASWGIRFAASHKNVMVVLSGMNEMEQLEDNISYMDEFVPLNNEELAVIEKVTEMIKSSIAIPCTGCRYCIEENECPMQIAIPDYFNIYNNLKRFGQKQMMVAYTYYGNLAKTHGKASACIECGMCEHVCPQHLSIRDYLKEVGKAFKDIREKVVIATKFGVAFDYDKDPDHPELILDSSPETIRKSLEGSLKRLQTDYIDLYYQHRIDPKVEPEVVAQTMKELMEKGKIRHWGISMALGHFNGR